jgi:hypothetical protein
MKSVSIGDLLTLNSDMADFFLKKGDVGIVIHLMEDRPNTVSVFFPFGTNRLYDPRLNYDVLGVVGDMTTASEPPRGSKVFFLQLRHFEPVVCSKNVT